MSAISELKRLPSTSKEVQTFCEDMLLQMETMNGYQIAEVMTYLQLFDKVKETIKKSELVQRVMIANANEKVEVNGFRIEQHVSTSYKFDNDPVWGYLKKQLAKRKALMKVAMTQTIYDEEGIEVTPAIKTSGESYKLTLKK